MAAGEKKVSLMDHIASAPNDSKFYIVLDNGDYGYILKSELFASSRAYNATFIFDENPQTVPAGFTGIITNLNNIYANVTFTVSGTELMVTGGADSGEKLLINGKY